MWKKNPPVWFNHISSQTVTQWQHMIGSIGCSMNRLVVKQLPGSVCHSAWWEFKDSFSHKACFTSLVQGQEFDKEGTSSRVQHPEPLHPRVHQQIMSQIFQVLLTNRYVYPTKITLPTLKEMIFRCKTQMRITSATLESWRQRHEGH